MPPRPPYSPYPSEAVNTIYNLLFCDDASAFLAHSGGEPAAWQAALEQDPPDLQGLRVLAADERQEGRVRYLAYQNCAISVSPCLPENCSA